MKKLRNTEAELSFSFFFLILLSTIFFLILRYARLLRMHDNAPKKFIDCFPYCQLKNMRNKSLEKILYSFFKNHEKSRSRSQL